MTELLSGVEAPSDAELISRVRGGDVAAYGQLFSRHVDAARRLGRQLVRGHDVDDLVSDAFAKTLQVLQAGGGPDVAFRAYLLTSVRRLHVDRIRAAKKVQPTDDMSVYDDGLPFQDTAVASFENGAAAKAFSSLPERWQLVLWHLEVEGQKPAEIAPLLGMSANSVSALAYRAREGLRQAFLTMHLADCPTEECRWVNEHLGAYVRKGLSRRDTTKVEEHLDGCRRCTAMYLELNEVNSNLAGIIAPLLLGAAAAGYISSAGGAATGVSAFIGRIRDTVGTNGGGTAGAGGTGSAGSAASVGGAAAASGATAGSAVTAGGLLTAGGLIAAGVAAVTTAAFVFGGGPKDVVTDADQPVGIVQTPPEAGAGDSAEEDGTDASEDAAEGPTDTTLITPDEAGGDAQAPVDAEVADPAAPPAGQPAPDGQLGAAPGPADAPAPQPDGKDGPGDGPDDGPDDGPGDSPVNPPAAPPVDPPVNPPAAPAPGVPQVDVPLPPAGSPAPPVKTPAPEQDGAPANGGGTVTNPGGDPVTDPGTGGDTVTGPGSGGGTVPDTEGGPGRSDGQPGGGNDSHDDNPAADPRDGTGPGTAPAPRPDDVTPPDPTEPTDGGSGQTGDSGSPDGSGDTGTGTTEPGAGDGGGQGGDAEQPPAVIQTSLTVAGPAIVGDVLQLDIEGDPVLPAEVTISLTSTPGGITFAQGGTCQLAENALAVTCSPTVDLLGAGSVGLRAMTDGTPGFRAAIPLSVPEGLDRATLSLSVTSSDDNVAGQTSAELEYDREGGTAEDGNQDPVDGADGDEGQDPVEEPVDGGAEEPVFGFVGDPEISLSGSGSEAHRHTVRIRLAGVHEGDQVNLTLEDNGTWFCTEDACSPAGSQTRTVVASGTENDAEGRSTFVYEFDVWLPGNKSVSLNAVLAGAAPSSSELVSSPRR